MQIASSLTMVLAGIYMLEWVQLLIEYQGLNSELHGR
jgi:hypothetical protein